MSNTPTPSRLIPIKAAAARIGLPYSSLRDMAFRGELRVFRSGENERYSRWYLDAREVDTWVESRLEKLA